MKIISSLLLIVFFYTNGFAVEQKKITDDEQWSKKVETLNWKNLEQKEHSKEIKKANASILILEEEIYLDNFKDIDKYNWWNTGLAAEKASVMLIRGVGYTIYLDYIDNWRCLQNSPVREALPLESPVRRAAVSSLPSSLLLWGGRWGQTSRWLQRRQFVTQL